MKIFDRLMWTLTHLAAPRPVRGLEPLRGLRQAPAKTPTPAAAAGQRNADLPEVGEIEEAARLLEQAREQANAAARAKRKAEKVLSRVPDGTYGAVQIERVDSGRQTADLDAIRAIFAEHGLGEVPMKPCAPSLVITWAAEAADAQAVTALAAA